MSDAFAAALEHVLSHEGGYVDHPRDPGGATNFGITLATLSRFRGRPVTKAEVRALTLDEAKQIYRRNYWDACRCGDLPPQLAFMVFDCAVNQGPARAITFLQAAVGTTQDGVMGPKTKAAAWATVPKGNAAICEYAAQRMKHYGSLSTFSTFGLGWSRRLMTTLAGALSV